MNAAQTVLLLIGYQNDYFSPTGILRDVVEAPAHHQTVLSNTLDLVQRLAPSPVRMVDTPIVFTDDYHELVNPIGILNTIKELGAFKVGSDGVETIPELQAFANRITTIPGKRGLNAFSNTALETLFQQWEISDIVIAGAISSICVDSTGRHAHSLDYRVTILSDCTLGRSPVEQAFYCEQIFPLYAQTMTHHELLQKLDINTDSL
ncbi:Isochorismatase [hydrothermal vent metagenome]|uniref:Isochorismatase n=1 Tax=hydrothermal vent metagenome TaxID=652676 RepID=A0A3B1AUD8_9ZZZZ